MISHGVAELKSEIVDAEGNAIVNAGDIGMITTYLPKDEIFAVMFEGDKGWYTFKETKKEFNNRFEVTLYDDNQPDSSND
jgi:c-di-GMP-binding flagellar brake protein YcgR